MLVTASPVDVVAGGLVGASEAAGAVGSGGALETAEAVEAVVEGSLSDTVIVLVPLPPTRPGLPAVCVPADEGDGESDVDNVGAEKAGVALVVLSEAVVAAVVGGVTVVVGAEGRDVCPDTEAEKVEAFGPEAIIRD